MKTDKLKKGDIVASKELPEIRSKIIKIEPSHFNDETMYYLANGCIYARDEIVKI